MSKRQDRRCLARWDDDTRRWATETARDLVMAMVTGQPMPATPYRLGIILGAGEQIWAECPVRFLQELPCTASPSFLPPIPPWLVTSERIAGRLWDDRLYGWRWDQVTGFRSSLAPGREMVALDLRDGSQLQWAGAGIAPVAVVAIVKLCGVHALIDHPALGTLRSGCTV